MVFLYLRICYIADSFPFDYTASNELRPNNEIW